MKAGSELVIGGELILSGMVLLDEYAAWMWDEDVYFTPRMVREGLKTLGDGRATVRLSSGGGHAMAGEAIRAILATHPGGCDIVVEGIAASAASLLFMAGMVRGMTEGSFLMIHDPAGITAGNEADHLKSAAELSLMADTYAAVYGRAAGKSAAECRAIMRTETWFGAAAAVAEGFATTITDVPASMAQAGAPIPDIEAAKAFVMNVQRTLADRLKEKPGSAAADPVVTAAASSEPAPAATKEETVMSGANPAGAIIPAVSPVVSGQSADEILMQERRRAKEIRDLAAPFMVSGRLVEADVVELLDGGVSVADAGVKLMAKMAVLETPVSRQAAAITRDETDMRLEGMIGALMQKTDGPAEQFKGMRLKNLAIHLSGQKGPFSDADAVRKGMVATTMMGGAVGVSDFAYITTAVMNRTLREAYNRRAATWQAVSGPTMQAPDFRELLSVRFGGDFQLKKVLENGEYEIAQLKDEAEGLTVQRRGRALNLSFEAIINDDLAALSRIPLEFALAARTMESSMVWSLFRSNAALKSDGLALFHATHKNLGTAAVISATSVAAARKAMWEQTAFSSKDTDDFLQVEPNLMLVPPALEMVALQFTSQTMAAKDGDTNPFKSTVTAITVPNLGAFAGGSDISWYMVSSDLPPISTANLEGYDSPTIVTTDGMNPDMVSMSARHFFAAAVTEFRGASKNPGL